VATSSVSSTSSLPDAAIDAISAALAAADPAGVLDFALNCPACGHAWTAPLDAGAVLEADLAAWARATLAEVHTLAAAYGWTEAEVLALSPARRRVYLELLGAL
ncbi:MAG TPA: phage baseplate protein, partial [Verrucomicrobiota bacterium]|nr:phage baseplate protein [Verrucomicrobiota bacterium]